MIKFTSLLATALLTVGLSAPAVLGAETSAEPEKQQWSFAGPFGTYDKNQLQRGFQIFKDVCAGCHSAKLLAFRNLSEPGGPEFSEAQVKALAATYSVADPDADGGKRPGVLADRWPGTGQSDADLEGTFGIVPPDFSVLAKARIMPDEGFSWLLNYFTTYSEAGPDYIHALLTSYKEAVPEGEVDSQGKPFALPDGKYYNSVFPGHAIGMPPPLSDGAVTYSAAADGTTVPATVDQYSKDVAAFMMWVAEPHLNATKEAGFRVIIFLLLFAALLYMVKQKLWRHVEH